MKTNNTHYTFATIVATSLILLLVAEPALAMNTSLPSRDLEMYYAEQINEQTSVIDAVMSEREAVENKKEQTRSGIERTSKTLTQLSSEATTIQGEIEAIKSSIDQTKIELDTITKQMASRERDVADLYHEGETLSVQQRTQVAKLLQMYVELESNQARVSTDPALQLLKLSQSNARLSDRILNEEQVLIMEEMGREHLQEISGITIEKQGVQDQILMESRSLDEMRIIQRNKLDELGEQEMRLNELRELTLAGIEEQRLYLTEQEEQMREAEQIIANLDLELDDQKEVLQKLSAAIEIEKRRQEMQRNVSGYRIVGTATQGFNPESWLNNQAQNMPLQWPVQPTRGISARFSDAGYKATFGVDHGAIDIPAPQGSVIEAPALGYVYKYQDNGYGYSYLMIAHQDNLMTVYGHVTESLVKVGDVVYPGDPIALVGGTPGTKGAGNRTTGSHLHLEVYDNGVRKDPLLYLPAR